MLKICHFKKYKNKAFTLIEVIIVVSIIALLSTVVLYANIKSSLEKARDSKRKQDLNKLVRIFEDYYNDSLAYPRPNPGYGTISGADWGMEFHNITLPKDPLSPVQTYYYDSDSSQTYFVLYAKLENKDDGDITLSGCKDGCGPNLAYNYAIHSSNVQMIAGVPFYQGQGQGGEGGGGGGGGGGTPVPTPTKFFGAPTPAGPTPTFNPTPPVNCSQLCNMNQCCAGCWCGDFSNPPGVHCEGGQYCFFETLLDEGYPYSYPYGWECVTNDGCALIPTPTPTSSPNIWGVMMGQRVPTPTTTMIPTRLALAQNLGAKKYRPPDVDLAAVPPTCSTCQAFKNAGFDIILTVRNDSTNRTPPSDINAYKTKIGQVLDNVQPALLVVENEENSSYFYIGTTDQYHAELAAACSVAHSKGYKCTNGGIVSLLAVLLTGYNYYQQGSYPQADSYFSRTLNDEDFNGNSYYSIYHANPAAFFAVPAIQDMINKGLALINGYAADGADYLNFHWYEYDAPALAETANYLASKGLNVITNEVGQQEETIDLGLGEVTYNASNPFVQQVTDIMSEIQSQYNNSQRFPIAVWFSIDINQNQKAYALNNMDGSLRTNGDVFKSFPKQ